MAIIGAVRKLFLLLLLCLATPAPASSTSGTPRESMFVLLRGGAAAADAEAELRRLLPSVARLEALPALHGWIVEVPIGIAVEARRSLLAHVPQVAYVALHGAVAPAPDAIPDTVLPAVPSPTPATDAGPTLGLIDLGADLSHPLLAQALGRVHFQPGTPGAARDGRLIRSHGTAMAGIYAQLFSGRALRAGGVTLPWLRLPRAVSPAHTLIAHAGPETRAGRSDLLRALNWMMTPDDGRPRPDVIGYSQGNGRLCVDGARCTSHGWSGVSRVLDRLADEHGVILVKSAGNQGDGEDNTMTVPGDTWNGITVGNVHAFDWQRCAPSAARNAHKIYRTSSVAPADTGLRLLDLVAPGVRIETTGVNPAYCRSICESWPDLTCAFCERLGRRSPAHEAYWKSNTGTSPAAAIVAAYALYLVDAGVRDPRAVKALLINSADAWTSDGTAHPHTRGNGAGCDSDRLAARHGPWPYGSRYDSSYGYGYFNPARAEAMRSHVTLADIAAGAAQCYTARLEPWDKMTLAWHRHAGDGGGAAVGELDLSLYEASTGLTLDADGGRPLDNVRQVSNGRGADATPRARTVILRIDARANERYALASAQALRRLPGCDPTPAPSPPIRNAER